LQPFCFIASEQGTSCLVAGLGLSLLGLRDKLALAALGERLGLVGLGERLWLGDSLLLGTGLHPGSCITGPQPACMGHETSDAGHRMG